MFSVSLFFFFRLSVKGLRKRSHNCSTIIFTCRSNPQKSLNRRVVIDPKQSADTRDWTTRLRQFKRFIVCVCVCVSNRVEKTRASRISNESLRGRRVIVTSIDIEILAALVLQMDFAQEAPVTTIRRGNAKFSYRRLSSAR